MKKFSNIPIEIQKEETPIIAENLVIIIPYVAGDGFYLMADGNIASAFSAEVIDGKPKETAQQLLRSIGIDIDTTLPEATTYRPDVRAEYRHYLYIIDCSSAKELVYLGRNKRVYIPMDYIGQVKTIDAATIIGLNIINSMEKAK